MRRWLMLAGLLVTVWAPSPSGQIAPGTPPLPMGNASEGLVVRVTTGANASVTYMDTHLGVRLH